VKIAALATRYRAPLYVLTGFLALAGLASLGTLPSAIYPEVAYPRIVIVARSPTFEATEMTVAVTRPIEEAMSGLIGLRRIRSRTVRGSAEISLDFAAGADMPFALQQVQSRVAPLQASLPGGVELTAERLTPALFPIIQYELTGASPVELRDLATYLIRPRLVGLPDVGTVEVQGGLVREIAVELDPVRLVNHGISVPEVADAIASANVMTAAGRVDKEYRQLGVLVGALTATPSAVGNIVLPRPGTAPVRVSDLGAVHYGVEDRFQVVAGNGLPAALINVARQPNGNAITVQAAVAATVDSLRAKLPAGVRLELVYDQAALVRESLATVRDAMLVGATLAVLILFGFLGSWRSTAVAALSLPLAVLGTFVGLRLTGQSLNLMSMGGLAVAIGLIIDDAVVIVENIERRLAARRGANRAATVQAAADELFGPVAGSTLTTIVVFTPLGLLEGVVGDFFRAFSLALAVAVALSLVLAVTLIPALLASGTAPEAEPAPKRRNAAEAVERRYLTIVGSALRHPAGSLLAAGALAVLAMALAYGMPTGFLPEMDEGGFILDYWAPTGTALAETDRLVGQIEQVLRADPDIQAFSRRTGLELGLAATIPSRGDIAVLLKPRHDRAASAQAVIDRVRTQLEGQVPGVRVEFVQILQDIIGDLAGAPEPVEIKLFNPDQATAEAAGRTVAQAVESIPGLVDLFDGVPGPTSVLRVDVDPARAARLGLSTANVGAQAQASLFGAPAGFAREANRLVPIRARLPDSVRLPPTSAIHVGDRDPDHRIDRLGAALGPRHRPRVARTKRDAPRQPSAPRGRDRPRERLEPRDRDAGDSSPTRRCGASRRRQRGTRRAVRRAATGVSAAARRAPPRRSRGLHCARHAVSDHSGADAAAPGGTPRRQRRVRCTDAHRRAVQRLELHGIDSAGGVGREERHHPLRCRASPARRWPVRRRRHPGGLPPPAPADPHDHALHPGRAATAGVGLGGRRRSAAAAGHCGHRWPDRLDRCHAAPAPGGVPGHRSAGTHVDLADRPDPGGFGRLHARRARGHGVEVAAQRVHAELELAVDNQQPDHVRGEIDAEDQGKEERIGKPEAKVERHPLGSGIEPRPH